MTYTVLLERRAEKDLRTLPADVLRRVDVRLRALAQSPISRGSVKLHGKEAEGWRVRVGDYRILYTVDQANELVRVYRIRHRKEAYG